MWPLANGSNSALSLIWFIITIINVSIFMFNAFIITMIITIQGPFPWPQLYFNVFIIVFTTVDHHHQCVHSCNQTECFHQQQHCSIGLCLSMALLKCAIYRCSPNWNIWFSWSPGNNTMYVFIIYSMQWKKPTNFKHYFQKVYLAILQVKFFAKPHGNKAGCTIVRFC